VMEIGIYNEQMMHTAQGRPNTTNILKYYYYQIWINH
jgi:hypothetical protein